MLESEVLLNLMTKHFPRWMDIRKRVDKSRGGKLLNSFAQETANIQEAIEEYKKDFFLINYLDKYDSIPYYVYYITIGNIDTESLVVTQPSDLTEVYTKEDFYKISHSYYYEDNKLYFKSEDIDETNAQIKYTYSDIEYTTLIYKLYVWNIYDEFAAFVGLKRYYDENNEELTKRILNVFRCVPNSSEDGIKNSIITSCINTIEDIYDDLSFDEIRDKIIIERPTPENLALKYDEFTTILEKLGEINKDVYRFKTWDYDIWNFKLSSIDYLPHTWDYALLSYQNGVGFDDDLKPEIIKNTDDATSADVTIYKKDIESITTYLTNNSIDKYLNFTFTKYSDDLNPVKVDYQILAADLVDITSLITDSSKYISLSINYDGVITERPLKSFITLDVNDKVYINNITESFIKYNTLSKESELIRISYDMLNLSYTDNELSNVTFSVNVLDNKYNVIFVTYSDVSSRTYDITNKHSSKFNYFYLVPYNSNTYTANNRIQVFSKETYDIEIVDNFYPLLPNNNLLVYVIKNINNCEASFNNDNYDEIINSWSFGKTNINITSTMDYENIENTSISINKLFSITNPTIYLNNIIDNSTIIKSFDMNPDDFDICEYDVVCNNENIKLTYSSNMNTISNIDIKYLRSAKITSPDYFIKLPCANIDEILYMGEEETWNQNNPPVSTVSYDNVIKDKGIIVFDTINDLPSSFIIVYTVKVPEYITIDINELYSSVNITQEAYNKIADIHLSNINNDYTYNLLNVDGYENSMCNVLIRNYASNYIPSIVNDSIVFKKIDQDILSIKYGYYYFGEREYYLLPNSSPIEDAADDSVQFINTVVESAYIVTHKENTNYIHNSKMTANTIGSVYYANLLTNNNIKGVSLLNSVTSCNNFFKWKTFGADLQLTFLNNNLAIKLNPYITNGYCYLDITNKDNGRYYISMLSNNKISAYICKENKYDSMRFHRSLSMTILKELKSKSYETNINELYNDYVQEESYNYYLVVTGSGIFDDIILCDYEDSSDISHVKNIDKLGLNIQEKITDNNYTNRLYFDSNSSICDNTEVDQDGYIINTSNIDWGMTKIFDMQNESDFTQYILRSDKVMIENDMLQTQEQYGFIETTPIYIEDISIIKNIIFEINDIQFNNMKDFQTKLSVSKSLNGIYNYVDNIIYDNYGAFSGELLSGNYVKFYIIIPPNKVIGNFSVYSEYKTTENSAPTAIVYPSGSCLTAIIDAYNNDNYTISKIDIENINNSDIKIYVRSFKDDYVWTSWNELNYDENGNIIDRITYPNSRYFQAKVDISSRGTLAKVRINSIDIKKVN